MLKKVASAPEGLLTPEQWPPDALHSPCQQSAGTFTTPQTPPSLTSAQLHTQAAGFPGQRRSTVPVFTTALMLQQAEPTPTDRTVSSGPLKARPDTLATGPEELQEPLSA